MDEFDLQFVAAIVSLIGAFVLLWRHVVGRGRPKLVLPPGPRPWPVIGNLGALGTLPHQSLAKLAKKYGPLMFLRLGSTPAIVVTSPKIAEEVLKTHDRVFASRPASAGNLLLIYQGQGIAPSPYGPRMIRARKVLTMELLSGERIEQFKDLRREEILSSVHSILEDCEEGKSVRMNQKLGFLTTNLMTRMLVNKIYFGPRAQGPEEAKEFHDNMNQMFRLFGLFHFGDYINWLKNIDVQGHKKLMTKAFGKLDRFLQNIVDEHRKELEKSRTPGAAGEAASKAVDFVEALLTRRGEENEEAVSDEFIKCTLQESIFAGTEPTSSTVEWALSELIKHPHVLAKAQQELDSVVGRDRLVQESDIPNLHYLRAITKETFRLHPVAPLLIPHESFDACEVAGYYVPAGSRLFVNIWAIGRDPEVWENPLQFSPERFENSAVDVGGLHFQFLPFGSGRRSCPGKSIALLNAHYILALFMQCCDWSLPQGMSLDDLSMDEQFGLSLPRANRLSVVATARLPMSVLCP